MAYASIIEPKINVEFYIAGDFVSFFGEGVGSVYPKNIFGSNKCPPLILTGY